MCFSAPIYHGPETLQLLFAAGSLTPMPFLIARSGYPDAAILILFMALPLAIGAILGAILTDIVAKRVRNRPRIGFYIGLVLGPLFGPLACLLLEDYRRKCPACRSTVDQNAIVCRNCRRSLSRHSQRSWRFP